MLNSAFFQPYSFKEVQEAREWVDESYEVNTPIKTVWHPVIRLFCELKNTNNVIF